MIKLIKFVSSFIILFILDFIYLYFNQNWYKKEIIKMQSVPLKLNWFGVFIRYLSQSLGLYLFILNNNYSPLYASLYGLIIYSNYIATNYATIINFDEKLAITDFIKGGVVMYLTSIIYYYIY